MSIPALAIFSVSGGGYIIRQVPPHAGASSQDLFACTTIEEALEGVKDFCTEEIKK